MNMPLRLCLFAFFLVPSAGADETKPVRTGQGGGIYETVPGWPKYPEGKQLGDLHGDLAADSRGNVYIATGNTIQVIGPDGIYKGDIRTKAG
ncbi:MAG: hypothetical protein QGG01_08425, partial [Roseibacillus sp.]|nr:hypothetical protein [Roseibacillus sp.]